jgi:hypothetical protein
VSGKGSGVGNEIGKLKEGKGYGKGNRRNENKELFKAFFLMKRGKSNGEDTRGGGGGRERDRGKG